MTSSTTYDPKLVEGKWYAFWEKKDFFHANPTSDKPPFCIVIPPPNVTGVLHMGHALVDTIQDVLIRWKRMQGFETLWVPGTDHAGIATQSIVERNLYIQTGKRRADFSREEFLSHVWAWKEQCESRILSQLRQLGCSCDWKRLRFTMDERNNHAVRSAFKKMFDEKLIYQGDYLVNWDPVAQTALSDDEVEHEEQPSFLWHIRYPLAEGHHFITVATTRPETMLGDTAVAVHPNDERYVPFIGKSVRLPLSERLIPVIADSFVDPSFGTGAVKITPAHDFNDFEMAQRHGLPIINILTPDARINERGNDYAGLSVDEARIAIVHALQNQGDLVKVEPHLLRVGVSYRSKAVIQPYLSKQWFIRMGPFKERLISAVKEKRVTLIPSDWEQTYFHWIENLRDWCISRQLWWGHRIPIWYGPNGKIVCWDGKGDPPEAMEDIANWSQDPDVLDTWFSSSLWPFSALGWPDPTVELKKFYPTSTLVTAHDILFFWVARMILMGEFIMHAPPFHEAFLHGLIYGKSYWKKNQDGSTLYLAGEEKMQYDRGMPLPSDVGSKWEKMSKTKGNIIDPLQIIETYGTDALRIALCSSVTHARQIDLDLRRFEEYKNFANKIWNGARFVFLHLEGFSIDQGLDRPLFTLEDQWILSLLNRTIEEVNSCFSRYAFDRAATLGYEFFWNDFCSIYLEIVKPVLFGKFGSPELKANKQKILFLLLLHSIRLLHPITPFITEELFSKFKAAFPSLGHFEDPYFKEAALALSAPACIVSSYPNVISKTDINLETEKEFHSINEIVRVIRNIRTEMQIPPSEKTALYLIGQESREFHLAKQHQRILLSLTPTASLIFSQSEPKCFGASALWGNVKLVIPIPETFKAKEKMRLEKEREKLEKLKKSALAKLSNREFRSKAPQEIVKNLEKNLEQIKRQMEEIAAKLKTL
ncbi:MAG TPA: valine--tRNA ligase [Chlamydiales bacterium]|nr:valine--tRNA ligase [Chlamydiales bacterium]